MSGASWAQTFIAQCTLHSEVTNSSTRGGEMSESGWQRLKNVQTRSRENVCGLGFSVVKCSCSQNLKALMEDTKGKCEASSRLPRARLTIAPTWPNTALQAELTIYMHWTKREVLRNYIRLYKTNHTFSEHLRRLSRNLRHFSVQHKNTVTVSAGGITLYSLRSHQLT